MLWTFDEQKLITIVWTLIFSDKNVRNLCGCPEILFVYELRPESIQYLIASEQYFPFHFSFNKTCQSGKFTGSIGSIDDLAWCLW